MIRELNKLIEIQITNSRNEQWANIFSKLPVGNKLFWKIFTLKCRKTQNCNNLYKNEKEKKTFEKLQALVEEV